METITESGKVLKYKSFAEHWVFWPTVAMYPALLGYIIYFFHTAPHYGHYTQNWSGAVGLMGITACFGAFTHLMFMFGNRRSKQKYADSMCVVTLILVVAALIVATGKVFLFTGSFLPANHPTFSYHIILIFAIPIISLIMTTAIYIESKWHERQLSGARALVAVTKHA
jgi:uncharacterized membrane protein